MMKHLKKQGIEYIEKYPGIYYLTGSKIDMQLLCIPQLSKKDNFWLHYLTNQLENFHQAEELIRRYRENKENNLYKSVMDIIVRANKSKFEEAKEMCKALEELMEEELKERKKLMEEEMKDEMKDEMKERENQALQLGLERGLERGFEQGIKAFVQDNIDENVPKERILQKLIKRFELTEERAESYYTKFAN